ncbi:MAG TPA: NAD-dependent epimerase/dehydratase family protein [Thermoplasmata archaeon]|nr:NAD-dependent epimerase/dehydratase family protein [Thermoplasmata archaeon]
MDGRRVLVTGGAGFIGSHVVERLSGRNLVTVIDDLSTGSLQNLEDVPKPVRVKRSSILQPKVLGAAIKDHEIVYHLAAKTSVPESVQKPQEYWRTNVEGTLNVLKAAVDAGARRVVFASSAAIYGNVEDTPTVETQKPAPASPYATTKMVGEFACEEIASLKGIETVVLRIFNVYGPRQPTTSSYASVIPTFCSAIAANRPIEIHGDGQQTRDFLYIGDLAEALELAGDKGVAGETFNVGSGIATSVADVATVLSEITNAPVRATRKEPRPGDVRHSQADIGKAAARLGFTPRTSLRDGMEKTLAYFRAAEAAR